jgi:hypothetical protein
MAYGTGIVFVIEPLLARMIGRPRCISAGIPAGNASYSASHQPAAMPEKEDSASATKGSEGRHREILECRVPAGREMLQILKHAGVCPKTPNDPKAAPSQPVGRHRNRGRPSIGNEMLELSRKVCSNHLLRRKQRRAGADLPVDLRSDDSSSEKGIVTTNIAWCRQYPDRHGRDRSTGGSGKDTVATLP